MIVGSVNPYPERFEAINEVDFTVTDSSLTPIEQGVYNFTATFQNTGDVPVTASIVPTTWEKLFYQLPLTNGEGILIESEVGHDLNNDKDKLDSFNITWYPNADRQYDALINNGTKDIHAYSLCEGPSEAPWSNRTYYINGGPKIFHLGTEAHVLYIASNDLAEFGLCDAVLRKHPSPCFQLSLVSQDLIADDFYINRKAADINYTFSTLVHEEWRSDFWVEARNYLIPCQASEIDVDERITFSCILTAYQDITSEITYALTINWSPDGNIRYRRGDEWPDSFEAVPQPNFDVVDSSFQQNETGIYQFNATVKNTGDPATQGTSPWQYANFYYELPLTDGKGTLDETILGLDLNGDADRLDEFDVEWVPTSGSQSDAIIDGVYIHSLNDAALEPLNGHPRRYYINNEPKIFTLGTETHLLVFASDDLAGFELCSAHIFQHPSPYLRILVFANVSASDFKINGKTAEVSYTWSMEDWSTERGFLQTWIVPIEKDINSGEEVEFSCTLIAHETKTCDIYLLGQWSPYGDTSYRWGKIYREEPITKHTTTTTTTTTITPGFSFLTAFLLILPLLIFKLKKKRS